MEIEEIEDSDRSISIITFEPPSEVIVEIDAILRLGALPVCELDESRINIELNYRWRRSQLALLNLEKIDKIEPVSQTLLAQSIDRLRSNSEPGTVVNTDTDAGVRLCGNIDKISVGGDCPGEETSAIVSSDRFCVLRVINGTARPALDGSIVPSDRNPFCSAPADSPRATESHRGRSPP